MITYVILAALYLIGAGATAEVAAHRYPTVHPYSGREDPDRGKGARIGAIWPVTLLCWFGAWIPRAVAARIAYVQARRALAPPTAEAARAAGCRCVWSVGDRCLICSPEPAQLPADDLHVGVRL